MSDVSRGLEWRAAPAWDLLPVVVILDTSGSMDEHGKLQVVEHCVRDLIDELSDEPWSDGVRLGLVGMGGDEAVSLQPLSRLDELDVPTVTASGGTPLASAIRVTASMLGEMGTSSPAHPPLVLLLTDGGWKDAWRPQMASFLAGSGRDSVRVCVAIGADADLTTMTGFTDEVVTVDTLPALASYLRAVTNTLSRAATRGDSPQEVSQLIRVHQTSRY